MNRNPVLEHFRYEVKRRKEHPYWGDTYDSFSEWLDHACEDDAYCKKQGYKDSQLRHASLVLLRYGSFVSSLEG